MTPETLREMAEKTRQDAQNLIDQYGRGVRPNWISAELSVLYDAARRYDLMATQIEAGSP